MHIFSRDSSSAAAAGKDWRMSGYINATRVSDRVTSATLISQQLLALGFSSGTLQIWEIPINNNSLSTVKMPMFSCSVHTSSIESITHVTPPTNVGQICITPSSIPLFTTGSDHLVVQWGITYSHLEMRETFSFAGNENIDKVVCHPSSSSDRLWQVVAVISDRLTKLSLVSSEKLFGKSSYNEYFGVKTFEKGETLVSKIVGAKLDMVKQGHAKFQNAGEQVVMFGAVVDEVLIERTPFFYRNGF